MLPAFIMDLILLIAPQYDVPSMLVVSIIWHESRGNPYAINKNNKNGTIDRGIMQLNSSWFDDPNWHCAETNIRAGISHLKELYEQTKSTSPYWWAAVVSFNCGLRWYKQKIKPPEQSIIYADNIITLWRQLNDFGY